LTSNIICSNVQKEYKNNTIFARKIMGYLIVILALFTVIFLHELGHLIAGLITGTAIKSFNIGFGRRFLTFHIFGVEVNLRIFLVLGGYVSFKEKDNCSESEVSIEDLTYWKKITVNLGGIFVNFVSAFATLVGLGMYIGMDFVSSIKTAVTLCATVIGLSAMSINKVGDFSSPIGLVSQGGAMIQTLPTDETNSILAGFLIMCTMLHLGVGFSNLLPLSILDGGQCIVDTVKVLTKKDSLARKILTGYELFSLFALGLLSVFLLSKDSIQLFKTIFKV
jgi:membrane-associated protease RseP (regulator of RpoE activity)